MSLPRHPFYLVLCVGACAYVLFANARGFPPSPPAVSAPAQADPAARVSSTSNLPPPNELDRPAQHRRLFHPRIVILCVGFVVIDKLTPYHLWKELIEEKNQALAVVVGLACLGICVIIASAMH